MIARLLACALAALGLVLSSAAPGGAPSERALLLELEQRGPWLWPVAARTPELAPCAPALNAGSYTITGGGAVTTAARLTRINVANTGPAPVSVSHRGPGKTNFLYLPKSVAGSMPLVTGSLNAVRIRSAGTASGTYTFS